MKSTISVILIFLLSVLLISCENQPAPSAPSPGAQKQARANPEVAPDTVSTPVVPASVVSENGTDRKELVFTTALMVENDVEIVSRLTGIIQKIHVDRGSKVKKGTPLASLQNEDLALEVEKARIDVQQTKAEYERAESLYGDKLLSESEYDSIRLTHESAKTELKLAKFNYEKSIIRAPFAGIVAERTAKIGQRVDEDENIPLFRVAGMEPLMARVFVPEEQLSEIFVGQKADFIPSISSSKSFGARVKWISSVVDPASGTVAIMVEIARGQGRGILKPGTTGKIMISAKQISQ